MDDNVDMAESLAMLLTIMGNETLTAHDGLEALDVAEAFRPDMMFLDIGMPELNGYEVIGATASQAESSWTIAAVLASRHHASLQDGIAGCLQA